MNEKFAGRNTEDVDLLKILLALKANTMRDLHVATLGILRNIDENEYVVRPFPNVKGAEQKNIICVNGYNNTLSIDDIVVVLFTDRNSIQALKQARNRQHITELTNDEDLHSERYGVIISKISFNEEEQ